jgi:autotransporter-associated beta strand protein
MIWFLSDNGAPPGNASRNEPLRGNKGTLREGGIRVPFLLRWKDGGVSAGRTVEDPVSALDIVPTSLAAAGNSRIVTIDSGVTLTNSGAIANGTTANALVKAGSGELVLSASNTYTGGVTINCAACGGRWRKCFGRRLADAEPFCQKCLKLNN